MQQIYFNKHVFKSQQKRRKFYLKHNKMIIICVRMGARTVKMQSAREFLMVIPFYSYRINNVINTATQASTATVISDNLKAAAISAITVPVSAVK